MDTAGVHYTACFWGVDASLLDDLKFCSETIVKACLLAGCEVLNLHEHKFMPQGVSINATLSTSHCAIHTWPEEGYCAIDLYGCGPPENLSKGIAHLVIAFKPGYSQIDKKLRGVRHDQ
jgi:S-adenosylmethionine decarboxylase